MAAPMERGGQKSGNNGNNVDLDDCNKARDIVLACCVLHNFCILSNDKSSVEDSAPEADEDDDAENNCGRSDGMLDRDAAVKRENVMRLMGLQV